MKNDKVHNSSSADHQVAKKVLMVTHNYIRHPEDFSGVFLHLLARKLLEKNIEIHVVAPHDKNTVEYEEIDGVKIHRYRYADENNETLAYRGDMHRQIFANPLKLITLYKFLRASYKLACSIIEREKIDIVSIQWMVPNGVVGRWLKKIYKDRIRLFLGSHGTDVRLLRRFPFLMRYLKPMIKKSECWTMVSSFLKNQIVEKYRDLSEKIRVVPMPNDETVFFPDDNIEKETDLIVAVSRFTVQKRLDYLLRAIKQVSENKEQVRLEIYGTGPEKQNLEQLIDSLKLSDRVSLLSPVGREELKKIYNRASMVVLNSIDEGFGLVLTEAMLCRTAVIGADSGGIGDIIENDKTGLLVPVDDAEKLSGAILRLLSDDASRNRLAEAGYRMALEKFSSESSARQFADLFRQ